ncbi:hypothetical protein [Gordonia sputi]|nr:hypothetical protein [Gordonia sputi]NKY93057.1 hypothetical protein [Gordonia sputi]
MATGFDVQARTTVFLPMPSEAGGASIYRKSIELPAPTLVSGNRFRVNGIPVLLVITRTALEPPRGIGVASLFAAVAVVRPTIIAVTAIDMPSTRSRLL